MPVRGIPKRWMTVKESPITMPAVAALAILLVTPRMTKTKTAVKITSTRSAPPRLRWVSEALPYPSVPRPCNEVRYCGVCSKIV